MKNTVKVIVLLLALMVPSSFVFAQMEAIRIGGGGGRDYVPKPKLVYPVSDTVDLRGKDELQFKWSPSVGSRAKRKYYDFRLYRGYEMLEDTLVMKEKVPSGKDSLAVKSSRFENGGVYTWSLRQEYYGVAGKSMRSFNSFQVIKK